MRSKKEVGGRGKCLRALQLCDLTAASDLSSAHISHLQPAHNNSSSVADVTRGTQERVLAFCPAGILSKNAKARAKAHAKEKLCTARE